MNKLNSKIIFAVLLAIVAIVFLLALNYRHVTINAGSGRVYVTDRWTGQSYYLRGEVRIPVRDSTTVIPQTKAAVPKPSIPRKPPTVEEVAIMEVKKYLQEKNKPTIKLNSKIVEKNTNLKPWELDWVVPDKYQSKRLDDQFVTVVRVYGKRENLYVDRESEENKEYLWTHDAFEFRISDKHIRQITDSSTGFDPKHQKNVDALIQELGFEL